MKITIIAGLLVMTVSQVGAQTRFRFPADDPKGDFFLPSPILHVDHDAATSSTGTLCTNHAGQTFPLCYDGHDGTDYLLRFGFATMDQNNVRVLAAAPGEVILAQDGNYDRCHGKVGFEVSCDGHPIKGNGVKVRHADGLVSTYWHFKKGSVKVKRGDKVSCGQLLGHVGSSGRSAMPHLHFEVADANGKVLDPYSGPKSQPESYWVLQVGPLGWPGHSCAAGTSPGSDGGAPAVDSGRPVAELPMGCAVQGRADPAALVPALLLGWLWWARRRGVRKIFAKIVVWRCR